MMASDVTSAGFMAIRFASEAVMMDAMRIPVKQASTAMKRPKSVSGAMSPYPTVVMVMKMNHIAFPMYRSFTCEKHAFNDHDQKRERREKHAFNDNDQKRKRRDRLERRTPWRRSPPPRSPTSAP